jgi:hypothetical protein
MISSKRDTEKRLTLLKQEVTRRGFNRYPSMFRNISDLPAELKSPGVTAVVAGLTLQSIIIFPPQIQRGWHYVPRQALVFSTTDVIHILGSIWPEQEPQVTCVKCSGLMLVRVTLILLYGSLEIVARGSPAPTQINLEFNRIAWDCISGPLRQVLCALRAEPGMTPEPAPYSAATQKVFEKLPLKFSNGVKIYGLLPGEELEELVFQPGTWKRWLHLLKRPFLANTLLLLTSSYLVVIQEDLEDTYGWIITYIPRKGIARIYNQPCSHWNELTIEIKRHNQISNCNFRLQDDATQALRQLWIHHDGQWQDLAGEGL